MQELITAVKEVSAQNNWDPTDLLTIMSYETGGTLNPWQAGPRTQWGQHRGLIQWGEPQARKYGVSRNTPVRNQVFAAAQFMKDHGVKPGDGLLPMYASINAGDARKIHASDANNGGAPGTVLDKVRDQMHGHRKKASSLLGGTYTQPVTSYDYPMGDPRDNTMSGAVMPQPYQTPVPDYNAAPAESASLWELQKAAWNTDQSIPWLMRDTGLDTVDPNFNLAARLEADVKGNGLDPERFSEFLGRTTIVNDQQYALQREAFDENQARVALLEQAGWTGTGMRIANSILDPVALGAEALAIAAMPASGVAVLGGRSTRLGRIVSTSLTAGVAGAASTGVSYAVNPNTTKSDMLMGTVLGFGVGGVAGSLMKNPAAVQEAYALQQAGRRLVNEVENEGMASAGSSVGAATASAERNFLNDEGFEFLTNADLDSTYAGAGRIDLYAMIDKSNIPAARVLGGLVQDGAGKAKGRVNAFAATEEKELFKLQNLTSVHRVYNPALREFRESTPELTGDALEVRFNELLDSYIRDNRLDRGDLYHPSVKRVGDHMARLLADTLEEAQNPFRKEGFVGRAVAGFEAVKKNLHYLPRFYDQAKIRMETARLKLGELERWVQGAVRSANPDIDPALLARLAKGMATGITNRAHGLDDLAMRSLGDVDIDDLADEVLGLSRDDKGKLRDYLNGKVKTTGGKDARSRRRVLLDETYRLDKVATKDGVWDEKGFGLDNLIVKDGLGTFNKYIDHMAGARALARFRYRDPVSGELLVDGITSDREWEKMIDLVRRQAADMARRGEKVGDVEMTIRRLNFAYSHLRGRPVSEWEKTNTGWWLRALRKFNFSRIMNQVGLAQIPEVGLVIGQLGVKAAFSQLPAMRRVANMSGETVLKSGLADDLEKLHGIGVERLIHGSTYRLDETSGVREVNDSAWKDTADTVLNKANRVTSEISGMTQANVMLERWAGGAIIQKFADWAAKGGKDWKLTTARLADLGLDDVMQGRVLAMLREPGNLEFSKGVITGKKVSRLNIDNWTDREAAQAFTKATFRLSREIIQKNDIGNLSMWMSAPLGKVLMQFRTFMAGSYVKQTLKGFKHRDPAFFAGLMLSSMLAGLTYVAQTQVQSIGRSDQDDFLQRRLSMDKVAASAFARNSQSSIIPMLVDSTGAGLFSHTRTTGQTSSILFGNPGMGLMDDTMTAATGIARGVWEGDYSQEEARALARLMPFSNALPVVMGLNGLIGPGLDLNERAPR